MLIRRSKCAGTADVVVDPLRDQNNVHRLSVLERTVLSLTSKHWTAASFWRIAPAVSRSEFVIDPLGFLSVTNSRRTESGHCILQRIGAFLNGWRLMAEGEGNKQPPAPAPDASCGPVIVGGRGTSSCSRVGRWARLRWIQRKSSNAVWTPLDNFSLPFACVLMHSACD